MNHPRDRIRNVPPPPGAKAGTVYSRFIPREELDSFAAWNPQSLSGAPDSGPGVQRSSPAEPAKSPEQELAEHLHAARQGGYQDGYRDGLAALESFRQTYAQQVSAQMGTLVQAYGAQMDALQQQMASALAVTAAQLARAIVRDELAARPELIQGVAHEAIEALLLSARHVTLRVHPDDQALVAQGAAEALAARGARLLADPTLERGGCVIESDIGVVDASLGSRWRRATAAVGVDRPWAGDDGAAEPLE